MTEDDRLRELRRRGEAAGIAGTDEMSADELLHALGQMAKGVDADTAEQAARNR
ncbi:hypothetical protein BJY24_002469 [Nocardia transvalensis]|uniref:Uncharacterized protein n=1 Tax=Nocardia transvalensis TaxID=37333 RepID=A0A7W9PCI3_9NOCA|nr:hypothetical protein [Nocardia transvalensis]MBB5913602.1 hypothetical protein [Nocardia transvalensis]